MGLIYLNLKQQNEPKMKKTLILLVILSQSAFGIKRYVKPVQAGSGSATSWAEASSNLALVLNASTSGDTVWVANGTYNPHATNRANSFVINSGVVVMGGFVGTESTPIQRPVFDINNVQTILSGEINSASDIDNSYNVVKMVNVSASTVLERFQITDGYNWTSDPVSHGGGIYVENGSPQITRCFVYNNKAVLGGGIALITNTSGTYNPNISECHFHFNSSENSGGGIFAGRVYSSTVNLGVSKCLFHTNESYTGGALYNGNCNLSVSNSVFYQNDATDAGSCYSVGNGSTNSTGKATMSITNCTFANNANVAAKSIINTAPSFTPQPTWAILNVTNSIIWDYKNDAIANGSTLNMTFTTYKNTAIPVGVGNLITDPLFVSINNFNGSDNKSLTYDDGLRLQCTSPAINSGNNAAAPASDIIHIGRPNGATVDRGAYEQITATNNNSIYVKKGNTGAVIDGTSWARAFPELYVALPLTTCISGLEKIKVTTGEYKPTDNTDVTKFFNMPMGVIIEGGYVGNTEEIPVNTNLNSLSTILSGDVTPDGNPANNSLKILVFDGTSPSTEVRYCKIQKGSGTDAYQGAEFAKGKIIDLINSATGSLNTCEISLNNHVDLLNVVHIELASTFNLKNSKYRSNVGYIENFGSFISTNNSFEENIDYGVIENKNIMTLSKCVFKDNTFNYTHLVENIGSSCTIDGSIFITSNNTNAGKYPIKSSKNIKISNCFFRQHNEAICIEANNETLNSVKVINCSFLSSNYNGYSIKNSASGVGQMNAKVKNCFFSWTQGISNTAGVTPDITYCSFTNLPIPTGTGNNLIDNEGFPTTSDWSGNDGVFFTEDDKYNLTCSSQTIDTGNNDADVPAKDITGKTRLLGTNVDRGPFERLKADWSDKVYVNKNSTNPIENGSTWATAFKEIYTVLENKACLIESEIWVAAGTYSPYNFTGTNLDFNKTFDIPAGLKIYGSFQGNETTLAQRPSSTFSGSQSILSGFADSQPTVFHVVTFKNAGPYTVLNGFRIEGGYAVGSNNDGLGGGILNISDNGTTNSPAISFCNFVNNGAFGGGAVANLVANVGSISSPTFMNCNFILNESYLGGAIYNQSDIGTLNPNFINCGFISNTANFGSQYAYSSKSFGVNSPSFYNCTIRKDPNSPSTGISFYSYVGASGAIGGFTPNFYNTALIETGTNTSPFFNNLPVFTVSRYNSYIESYQSNAQNKLNGQVPISPSLFDGLELINQNPLINEGQNSYLPPSENKDLYGNPRINCTIDIGCNENQSIFTASGNSFGTGHIETDFRTWQIYNTITSQGKINSGAVIGNYALSQINLLPGFEAKAGSVFKAEIRGCN